MCGIFGYIGDQDAASICIEGLKRLEYRGYDSSGIACIQDHELFIYKEVGKVAVLENILEPVLGRFHIGIAHTRWATHGEPTKTNAHPHIDQHETVAVVHNGVIENYASIREKLIKDHQIAFVSETDTEVIAQLLAYKYRGDLMQAARETFLELEGAFAVALVHKDYPDQIIAVAEQCPLIVAICTKTQELFVCSDVGSLPDLELELYRLEKGELALLDRGKSPRFFNKQGISLQKKGGGFFLGERLMNKGQYEHFMLKEIFEQATTVKQAMDHRYDEVTQKIHFDELPWDVQTLSSFKQIILVACGTSYHAGLLASYFFESLAKIESKAEIASEYCYKDPIIPPDALIIALSQSGETADTLAAVRLAKKKNAKVIGLCNVAESTLTQEVDATILMHAGPEFAVASTKTFTSQVILLYLLAIRFAEIKGLNNETKALHLKYLYALPGQVVDILHRVHEIESLAKKYARFEHMFFLGRSILYPTALEAALKLKEIAYVHAQGYPAGEMKHGPIALLEPHVPVVVFCAHQDLQKKIMNNLMECKARKAPILVFGWQEFEKEILAQTLDVFWIPKTLNVLAPVLLTLATQLFAYYIAKERGTEIDQPRNLAKSCTVE